MDTIYSLGCTTLPNPPKLKEDLDQAPISTQFDDDDEETYDLTSKSHYPGSPGNPFSVAATCRSTTDLTTIESEFDPYSDDLLDCSVFLLKKCQKSSSPTEPMLAHLVREIKKLITDFTPIPNQDYVSLYFIYQAALASFKGEIIDKNNGEIVAIFEEWVIRYLCITVDSIGYALAIKEYYVPSRLKNTIDYILGIFKEVSTNGSMKEPLEEARKKIVFQSTSFSLDACKKSDFSDDELLWALPFVSPPIRSWIIQEDYTSAKALLHRRKALVAFCNEKTHPIHRLKNLMIYLSYPIPLSSDDWELIEKQSYSWNQQTIPLIEIIDAEISYKLFQESLNFTKTMAPACQMIRRNLHPKTDLLEYLFSGMLFFSKTRIDNSLDLIKDTIVKEKNKAIFICLQDSVRILRTMQKLGNALSKIAYTPPDFFKELDSFFDACSQHLEIHVLEKSKLYNKTYKHWPIKYFVPNFLTPSQKTIRIIHYFYYIILLDLGTLLKDSENERDDPLNLIKILPPEIRFTLLDGINIQEGLEKAKAALLEKTKDALFQ